MNYLDYARLDALDAATFRSTQPYPWWNPEGVLTEAGFQKLRATLPEVSQFREFFGVARSHGQHPHDRLTLDYREDLPIAPPWHEFIAELLGSRYMAFIRRTFDRQLIRLNFHWHYTPNGCSVSPHCDAKRKLGSHIFYFNTSEDWNADWGGETVILDDHGRFKRESAPGFEAFDSLVPAKAMGNRSLLFARCGNSWHGVRPIECPEGRYRKVFIVVVNDWMASIARRVIGRMRGKPAEAYY